MGIRKTAYNHTLSHRPWNLDIPFQEQGRRHTIPVPTRPGRYAFVPIRRYRPDHPPDCLFPSNHCPHHRALQPVWSKRTGFASRWSHPLEKHLPMTEQRAHWTGNPNAAWWYETACCSWCSGIFCHVLIWHDRIVHPYAGASWRYIRDPVWLGCQGMRCLAYNRGWECRWYLTTSGQDPQSLSNGRFQYPDCSPDRGICIAQVYGSQKGPGCRFHNRNVCFWPALPHDRRNKRRWYHLPGCYPPTPGAILPLRHPYPLSCRSIAPSRVSSQVYQDDRAQFPPDQDRGVSPPWGFDDVNCFHEMLSD